MSQNSKIRPAYRVAILEALKESEGMTTEDLSLTTGLNPKTVRETALKMFNAGELARDKKHSHLLGMKVWHYRVNEQTKIVPLPKPEPLQLAAAAGQ